MTPAASSAATAPEIWAGVECSVVRVGRTIVDELRLTGHARRPGDLARLAALGISTVRYPALWERHPDPMRGRYDWAGTDRRLETMARLGLRPVLCLLHQGTGRRGEMLDPAFPAAFGAYASAVAERYPWVGAYNPINEPLTTARFAGLYGHWHPHHRDDATFAALVTAQALAWRAATTAIRARRPDALVIATEDVAETRSTPALAEQAAFDRARRWLVLDAATGRLGERHPLFEWLVRRSARPALTAAALADLAGSPAPPDLIGVHHYPTSDRFLDERLERYPGWTHGGSALGPYADVELVRVLAEPRDGLRGALLATWDRYAIPVALTEVHLGGPARDRRAWWWHAVRTAQSLAEAGVPVASVTAWAAFGSWEWASLLTRAEGHYEPGLFDMRVKPPRPTILASDVAIAAAGGRREVGPGWWQRPERLLYPPVDLDGRDIAAEPLPVAV